MSFYEHSQKNWLILSLRKIAQKPDFLNLSKIGKPYSIDFSFFVLTVLDNALSEKSIFNSIGTLKKMTVWFSQTAHLKKNFWYINKFFTFLQKTSDFELISINTVCIKLIVGEIMCNKVNCICVSTFVHDHD